MSFTAGNTRPSKFICGRRDLLTTGPAPDAGGSKPGKEGCDHMPEKSGMDGCALLPAGPTARAGSCPKAAVAAVAANVTTKRKSRRKFMIPSRLRFGRYSTGQGNFIEKLAVAHGYS